MDKTLFVSRTRTMRDDQKIAWELLTTLRDATTRAVAVALALLAAGSIYKAEIDLLGLRITRSQVVDLGTVVILALAASVALRVLKLRALITSSTDQEFTNVAFTLPLHPWSANPFGFYGERRVGCVAPISGTAIFTVAVCILTLWIAPYGLRRPLLGGVAPYFLGSASAGILTLVISTKRIIASRSQRNAQGPPIAIKRQLRFEVAMMVSLVLFCLFLWFLTEITIYR